MRGYLSVAALHAETPSEISASVLVQKLSEIASNLYR
jgi:hypothetical protein